MKFENAKTHLIHSTWKLPAKLFLSSFLSHLLALQYSCTHLLALSGCKLVFQPDSLRDNFDISIKSHKFVKVVITKEALNEWVRAPLNLWWWLTNVILKEDKLLTQFPLGLILSSILLASVSFRILSGGKSQFKRSLNWHLPPSYRLQLQMSTYVEILLIIN